MFYLTFSAHVSVQCMWHAFNATNTDEFPPEFGYFNLLGRSRPKTSIINYRTKWGEIGDTEKCVEFSLETDYSQESRCSCTVQQNIEKRLRLSSFFAQYSDSFRSQISDFISSEEVFERHLDAVLWYNGDQVEKQWLQELENFSEWD
ncbi:hypothetical protein cypCar_00003228 [Cyprinus carpio]|nr:hypothetical protein cypCar_00003228 [Cyprinus carpio]